MIEEYKLSHLKELEAESIHIIREVAAEFENPVMLYSIGKDSSVMVRLAEKAFAPGKVPFCTGQGTIPSYAYRLKMEIQGNDSVPR